MFGGAHGCKTSQDLATKIARTIPFQSRIKKNHWLKNFWKHWNFLMPVVLKLLNFLSLSLSKLKSLFEGARYYWILVVSFLPVNHGQGSAQPLAASAPLWEAKRCMNRHKVLHFKHAMQAIYVVEIISSYMQKNCINMRTCIPKEKYVHVCTHTHT